MSDITPADFTDPQFQAFLQAHLDDMAPTAPQESQHALDLSELRAAGVHVWIARDEEQIVGMLALAPLEDRHEELKSMRISPASRGKGVASRMLDHALQNARSRGVERISLETGSMDFFTPARALYLKAGFQECDPFGSYGEDSSSVYFTRLL